MTVTVRIPMTTVELDEGQVEAGGTPESAA